MIRVRVAAAQLVTGEVRLSGEEHHYLMRVRRIRVGERVELFDGAGAAAEAVVEAVTAGETVVRVASIRRGAIPSAQLTSAIPLLKGERMDQCIEKLVEVGCDRIVLWEAERAVVRLEPAKRAARLERIRAQILAAVRQSGRPTIPEVEGIWSLTEVVDWAASRPMRKVVLEPNTQKLSAATGDDAVVIVSGPEGGLAPKELEVLQAAAFEKASLMGSVLRAETAPVIAVAIWRWSEG